MPRLAHGVSSRAGADFALDEGAFGVAVDDLDSDGAVVTGAGQDDGPESVGEDGHADHERIGGGSRGGASTKTRTRSAVASPRCSGRVVAGSRCRRAITAAGRSAASGRSTRIRASALPRGLKTSARTGGRQKGQSRSSPCQ
jgi:hypothetical protein